MAAISVIIPTVRADTIDAAVASVLRQTHPCDELIVAAQGRLAEQLLGASGVAQPAWLQHVRLVTLTEGNASRARNAAMRAARGAIVAMMDDDCEATPTWLAAIEACFRADPRVGVVGGSLLPAPPDGRWPTSCPSHLAIACTFDPQLHREAPLGWDWLSANVAVRRSVLDRVGFFDECLGPGTSFPAGEDPEWKSRMVDANIVMVTTPDSVVLHTHGRRSGIAAVTRHLRNYARGQGALAAKYAMRGDRRAQQMMLGWWHGLHRPQQAYRLRHCLQAFWQCRAHYQLDASKTYLEPRERARKPGERGDEAAPRADDARVEP